MSIPGFISTKLAESLGQDAGGGLVTWLQEMRSEHEEKLAAMLADMRAERQADNAELRHQIASLIQASEARVTERIHAVEIRLTALEGGMDKIEQRLDGVEQRLDKVDLRLDKVEERVSGLWVRVAEVKGDLMKWSFVFWVGAVAAIAMLAQVLP